MALGAGIFRVTGQAVLALVAGGAHFDQTSAFRGVGGLRVTMTLAAGGRLWFLRSVGVVTLQALSGSVNLDRRCVALSFFVASPAVPGGVWLDGRIRACVRAAVEIVTKHEGVTIQAVALGLRPPTLLGSLFRMDGLGFVLVALDASVFSHFLHGVITDVVALGTGDLLDQHVQVVTTDESRLHPAQWNIHPLAHGRTARVGVGVRTSRQHCQRDGSGEQHGQGEIGSVHRACIIAAPGNCADKVCARILRRNVRDLPSGMLTPNTRRIVEQHWLGYVALVCAGIAAAILIGYLVMRPVIDLRAKVMLLLGLGVFPAFSATASTVAGMEATTQREFCGACHVMTEHFENSGDGTSQSLAARHSRNPFFGGKSCYVCHADYGMYGYAMTKAGGMSHVYHYYLSGYREMTLEDAKTKIRLNKPYDNLNCRQCHTSTLHDWRRVPDHESLKAELDKNEVSCASAGCHGFAHPFTKTDEEKRKSKAQSGKKLKTSPVPSGSAPAAGSAPASSAPAVGSAPPAASGPEPAP